jgi:thioredoxin-related protein
MAFAARASATLALLVGLLGVSVAAQAAQLLMLEDPGCVWCQRWNEEVGRAYPLTNEALVAPLRRVDITRPWPEDLAGIRSDRVTPTFILIDQGVEIARLRGYPGAHFFWPLLGEMLADLSTETKAQHSMADSKGN